MVSARRVSGVGCGGTWWWRWAVGGGGGGARGRGGGLLDREAQAESGVAEPGMACAPPGRRPLRSHRHPRASP
jgi:hypothetical protein